MRDIAKAVHMYNTKVMPTDLYALYKNRKYILEYIGETTFRYRAKLSFLDNTKSFWVDANSLTKCEDTETRDSVGEDRDEGWSINDIDLDIGDK